MAVGFPLLMNGRELPILGSLYGSLGRDGISADHLDTIYVARR